MHDFLRAGHPLHIMSDFGQMDKKLHRAADGGRVMWYITHQTVSLPFVFSRALRWLHLCNSAKGKSFQVGPDLFATRGLIFR